MPTVACITRSICSSRLAHCRVMAFFSLSKSSLHAGERFHDRLDPLAEARAGQITVNHLHFALLAFGRHAAERHLEERLTEHDRHGQRDRRSDHPDTVDEIE